MKNTFSELLSGGMFFLLASDSIDLDLLVGAVGNQTSSASGSNDCIDILPVRSSLFGGLSHLISSPGGKAERLDGSWESGKLAAPSMC